MNHLEGFHYDTKLDLNMGYHTTRLSPASKYMTTIGTEFGTYGYNRIHMGMCALVDIFQAKLVDLIGDTEGINTDIDDILVLSKDFCKQNIEQLMIIFGRLRAAGLKANYPKCSFGLNNIPYLGYVITREGIKPDLNKVQGIMGLERPTTTTKS